MGCAFDFAITKLKLSVRRLQVRRESLSFLIKVLPIADVDCDSKAGFLVGKGERTGRSDLNVDDASIFLAMPSDRGPLHTAAVCANALQQCGNILGRFDVTDRHRQ